MQNAGLYLCGAAGEGFFAFFWGRRLLELMLPEKIKLSGRAPSCRVSLGSRQRCRVSPGSGYAVGGLSEHLERLCGSPAVRSVLCNHRGIDAATDIESCGQTSKPGA